MGKIFPHCRHKARLSPPISPPQPIENDVELLERRAKGRETRQRLDDDRSRRMAERREKRERLAASWAAACGVLDPVERLAKDAFPWPLIARERRLFDWIVKPAPSIPATPRDFPQRRGLLWATYLVFGELAFEALHKVHPSAAQIEPETWPLITDLCPVTTDWQKLVKVAEFLGASVSAIHPVWAHREIFRWGAALPKVPRDWLAARIEAAREGRDGLYLTELGDGWFRVEDEAVLPLLWEKCGCPFGSYAQAVAIRAAAGQARPIK
jgi:hypothetical protein